MNLTDITTATITAKLAQLRGTGSYFVTEVGDTYIQATSFNGDEVVIEICNEKFMQRALPAGSDEELLRLGFTRPAKRNPNWWISIDGGQPELRRAADAAVRALVDVYGIDPDDIADAVDVPLSERAALASLPTAERRATTAHKGQVDKAGRPYIEHPRRVADRVAEIDGRAAAVCVAWLHDVVEDSDVTPDELRGDFDDAIVDAVDAVTRRDGEGDDYYRRVASNDLAVAVKRADIWDNTNPERLAALPASTRDRLQAKYAHALELLDQLAPPASATPSETVGDRDDSLGMDTEAIGRLMAYAHSGLPVRGVPAKPEQPRGPSGRGRDLLPGHDRDAEARRGRRRRGVSDQRLVSLGLVDRVEACPLPVEAAVALRRGHSAGVQSAPCP